MVQQEDESSRRSTVNEAVEGRGAGKRYTANEAVVTLVYGECTRGMLI